jgi:uncharacterized membrane protein
VVSHAHGGTLPEQAVERETARLEAFSDAVFAIAITILVLDLRLPPVEDLTPRGLIDSVLDQWPSYFAFALSFATILIMWINHHARMGLIQRIDGLLMVANGLVLFMIAALAFPTAIVGEYLTGPAGEGAVFVYAMFLIGTSAAWNAFMLAMRPERGLLRPGVPASMIAKTRRHVAFGFPVYVAAAGLSLVNAYLGLGVITAMWVFWGSIAYRALSEHRTLSTEA